MEKKELTNFNVNMSNKNIINSEVIYDDNQVNKEKITDIMKDLENKGNPKSVLQGLQLLAKNDVNEILSPLKECAKEFEQRTGRPMTYSEMRQMFG